MTSRPIGDLARNSKGELRRILVERLSDLTAMEHIQFEKKFSMKGGINAYSKKELAAMIRRCSQMAAQVRA